MQTLPVIFRKDKDDGAIVAIFPTIWETGNTVPAMPDKYAALLSELTGIYTIAPKPIAGNLRRTCASCCKATSKPENA